MTTAQRARADACSLLDADHCKVQGLFAPPASGERDGRPMVSSPR